MPKWAAELHESLAKVQRLVLAHEAEVLQTKENVRQTKENVRQLVKATYGREIKDGEKVTITLFTPIVSQLNDLRSRLGTSTPLIIWNIVVLIALAGIAAKVWGYAPY